MLKLKRAILPLGVLFALMGGLFAVPTLSAVEQQPPVAKKKHHRGAKPTPRHKLVSAPKHVVVSATPSQVAYVPKQLSYWLNNNDGDCVTEEEAFARDCTGIFIQDATVKTWATKNGYLEGANLT